MLKSKKTILGILLCAVMALCSLIGFMSVNPFKVEAKAWKGEAIIQFDSTLGHIEVDGDSKTTSPVTISMELNPTMTFEYDVYTGEENQLKLTDIGITFTIDAIPAEGCVFAGWKVNDETLTYTGELDSRTTITAVFEEAGPATFEAEFYFWDQNGDDVEGAIVRFVDASGAILVSGATDSDGLVKINVPLHQVGHFEVSKDGYEPIQDLFDEGDFAFSNPEEIYSYNTSSVLTKIADAVETLLSSYTYEYYPSVDEMSDVESVVLEEVCSFYDDTQITLVDEDGNDDYIYLKRSWIGGVTKETGTYQDIDYNYKVEINIPKDEKGVYKQVKTVETTIYVYVCVIMPEVSVFFDVYDSDYGYLDNSGLSVAYGTPYSVDGNVLRIGEETITATANEGYEFSHWELHGYPITSGIIDEEGMAFYAEFDTATVELDPISYVDENGATQTLTDYVELNADTFYDIFEEELPAGWYVVTENIRYLNTLVTKNDLHLVICDGAMLEISYNFVENEGKTLYVYGQANQTGTFVVRGGSAEDGFNADGCPAMDGANGGVAITGNLCVNGCFVTVQGGKGGNGGWGSAPYGDGGNGGDGGIAVKGSVTLNGGELTLIGGEGGYGGVEDGGKRGEKGKNGNAINTVPTVANGYKIFVGNNELSIVEYSKMSEISDFHCVKVLKLQTPVEYINEVGNVSVTTFYKNVTGDTHTFDGGTYVVSGTVVIDGSVSVENTTLLILCDGASLTINGRIDGNEGELRIYAQSLQTGSLTVNAHTERVVIGPTLTVSGGNVTINNEIDDAISNILCIKNTFTVYDGVVTVNINNSGTETGDSAVAVNGDVYVYGGSVTLKATDARNSTLSKAVGDDVTVTVTGGQLVMMSSGKVAKNAPTADGCEITSATDIDGVNTVTYNPSDIATYKYLKIVAPVGSITIADILPSYFPTSFETGWTDKTDIAAYNLGEGTYKVFVFNGYLILSKNGSENICSIAIDTEIEKVWEDFYTAKDSNENLYSFDLTNGIISNISITDSNSHNYGAYYIGLTDVISKSKETFPTDVENGWLGDNGLVLYADRNDSLMVQASKGKKGMLKAPIGEANISVRCIIQTNDGNYLFVDKTTGGNVLFTITNNYLTSITISNYTTPFEQIANGTYTAPTPAITVESIFNTVDNVWSWTSDKGESLGDVLSSDICSELVTTADNLTYTLSYNGMNISLVTDGTTLQSITIVGASFAKYDGTYTAPIPAHDLIVTKIDGGTPVEGTKDSHDDADYYWDEDKLIILKGGLSVSGTSTSEKIETETTVTNLTLAGVNLEGYGPIEFDNIGNFDLIIKDGTVNTISGRGVHSVVESNESLTIKGNGTLNVKHTHASEGESAMALAANDTLTIDGATVNVESPESSVDSFAIAAGTGIIITSGTVTAKAGNAEGDSYGVYSFADITVNGGTLTAQGYDSAMNVAPIGKVLVASTNYDGSSPVATYNEEDLNTYRYLKVEGAATQDLLELEARVKALEDLLGVDGSALNDLINQAIAKEVAEGGSIDQAIKLITDGLDSVIRKLVDNLATLDQKVEGYKGELEQLGDKDSKLEFLIMQSSEKMDMSLDQAKKELNKLIEDTAKELKDADAMNLAEITGKIEELSAQVDVKNAELQVQIDANKSAIEKLISDLNALDGKVEGYKGELDQAVLQLGDKDSKLEFLIKQSSEKMDMSLDQAKKEFNKLIEDTAKELKDADAMNLAEITGKIEELSAQVDAKNVDLQAQIEVNKSVIEKLIDNLATLDKKVEGYKVQLDKAIADLEGKDGELAGLIEANKTAIAKAEGNLREFVNGEVAKLVAADAKNLGELTAKIEELSAQVEAKNSELAGKIADNKAAIEKVAGDLENLDKKVEGYKTALDTEDVRLAGLIEANDQAIKAALEQAKTDINGLIASKVEELQGADTKNLADLTKMINDLSAQVEAKNSELAGKIADNKAAIEKVAKDLADLDAKLAESKAELESKDKQIEDNISTFVTVVIIVGAVFLIGIAGLYVLVLKKKREEK